MKIEIKKTKLGDNDYTVNITGATGGKLVCLQRILRQEAGTGAAVATDICLAFERAMDGVRIESLLK